ncbi:MAG TPA: MHYT domain-containing protein [Streptosporangiaceae bacterium]|nr:MHYT domain-containing protein [Streptosporangiaceae bacterium]
MLTVHNFQFGLLTPILAYLMSFLGAFLGLRCTARARATIGSARRGWLLVGSVSIGITGIWVMHFIAILGFAIPGQTIHFNVLITLASMLLAVAFVSLGLLFVGFGNVNLRSLLLAGIVVGLGVAAMHYSGMAAIEAPMRMTYNPILFGASVLIAIIACTAALWAALTLHTLWSTAGAAAVMGVAVCGMHYTGMAAMHMFAPAPGTTMSMNGPGGESFLLPLIVGVSILTFVLTATIALSPSDAELAADADLMRRIEDAQSQSRVIQAPPISSAARPSAGASRSVSEFTRRSWRGRPPEMPE